MKFVLQTKNMIKMHHGVMKSLCFKPGWITYPPPILSFKLKNSLHSSNTRSETQILNGIYYIKGVLSVIVGLCGLMGNAATITVLRMPTFKETFHKLLICLSCFDSIFIGKHFFLLLLVRHLQTSVSQCSSNNKIWTKK